MIARSLKAFVWTVFDLPLIALLELALKSKRVHPIDWEAFAGAQWTTVFDDSEKTPVISVSVSPRT